MTLRPVAIAALLFPIVCSAAEVPATWSADLPPAPIALKMRWDVLYNQAQLPGVQLPADPTPIHEAVKLSAESGAMLGENPLLRQSYWNNIDQMLLRAKPADLLPLRKLQENKAGALAGETRKQGDAAEAVRLFRRYPWAHSLQELLIEFGEDALRAGRHHWAARAFQEVLTHADDPSLIAQANIGLWCALAGQPERRDESERAMAAVPDGTLLPWRGGQAKAVEIKAAIRVPSSVPDAASLPALSNVPRVKFQLPAAMAAVDPVMPNQPSASLGLGPWTIRRIESAGDRLVVSGSRHVASYSASTQKLLRLCSDPILFNSAVNEDRPAVLGKNWSSIFGEGTMVYRLTAASRGDNMEYNVTALDTGSGRILWSTAGRDEWKELWPQSEPIAGEGHVYVLATGKKGTKSPAMYLVCLDGVSGAIAWKRLLGALSSDDRLRDLALGGSAITLHEGSLYVATDTGLLARCDVRDGALDWVRAYPVALTDERAEIQFRREGTAPLVADGKVFIAPRDHAGIVALEANSGRLLWETPPVPVDRMVGVAGQVLVTQGMDGLVAFNLVSGAEVWKRSLEDAKVPRAIVTGAHVLVVAGDRLVLFLAATGAPVDELRLNAGPCSEFALLADGSLAEFVEEPIQDPVEQPGSIAGPLRLPLSVQWTLPCERPLLVTGPTASAGTNTFGILSGRLLLCVEPQPRGRIVWQNRLPRRPNSVGFHGNLLVAARDHTLTALNATSGVTEWVLQLPFRADIVGGDERLLFAGEAIKTGSVAAIDPSTGKIIWQQLFGKETRLTSGRLEWIRLQRDAGGSPALHLYWSSADFGNDGNRPAEVIVDATTGGVREVKRFLPGEPQWPRQIAFNDVRTYVRLRRLPPWPGRGPFLPDAMAYVGDGTRAHFTNLTQGKELAAGLNLVMDVRPESQYWSSVGLNPTAEGLFVKRIGKLVSFDALSTTGTVYELPRNIAARTAYNILDFRSGTGTVMVVSGPESALPETTSDRRQKQNLISVGLTTTLPAQTVLSVDVFDRATGTLSGTEELPGAKSPGAHYANQAKLLDGGLLTTDSRGVYFLRSGQ